MIVSCRYFPASCQPDLMGRNSWTCTCFVYATNNLPLLHCKCMYTLPLAMWLALGFEATLVVCGVWSEVNDFNHLDLCHPSILHITGTNHYYCINCFVCMHYMNISKPIFRVRALHLFFFFFVLVLFLFPNVACVSVLFSLDSPIGFL